MELSNRVVVLEKEISSMKDSQNNNFKENCDLSLLYRKKSLTKSTQVFFHDQGITTKSFIKQPTQVPMIRQSPWVNSIYEKLSVNKIERDKNSHQGEEEKFERINYDELQRVQELAGASDYENK